MAAHCNAGQAGCIALRTEKGDFAGRVFSLQCGEVHHRDGEIEAGELGGGFDATFCEGGGAFFDHDLVNAQDRPALAQSVVAIVGRRKRFQKGTPG
jgi:hypothetical protein